MSRRGRWIFDDLRSFFHGIIGLIAGVAVTSNAPIWEAFGLWLATTFLIYEIVEIEPLEKKVGDLIEFGVGFIAGLTPALVNAVLARFS